MNLDLDGLIENGNRRFLVITVDSKRIIGSIEREVCRHVGL